MTNVINTVVYSLAPLRGPTVSIPCVPIGCQPRVAFVNVFVFAKIPPGQARKISTALCVSPPWWRLFPRFRV